MGVKSFPSAVTQRHAEADHSRTAINDQQGQEHEVDDSGHAGQIAYLPLGAARKPGGA